MSWKGLKKAVNRLPHQVMSKVGQADRTADEEYDSYASQITEMRQSAAKLNVDAQRYRDSVSDMLNFQYSMTHSLLNIYKPQIALDDDIPSQPLQNASPEQIAMMEKAVDQMNDLRDRVFPELDQIDQCVVNPTAEFLRMAGQVGKVIDKRNRKLEDYDRVRAGLRKLREKTDRKLDEDRKIHQMDNQFEEASRDFNFYNDALKADLPKILTLRTRLIEPCLVNFYQLQVKIHTTMIQSLQTTVYTCGFDPNTTAQFVYNQRGPHARSLIDGVSVTGHFHTEADLTGARPTSASSGKSVHGVLGKATGLFQRTKSNAGSTTSLSGATSPKQPEAAVGHMEMPKLGQTASNDSFHTAPAYSIASASMSGGGGGGGAGAYGGSKQAAAFGAAAATMPSPHQYLNSGTAGAVGAGHADVPPPAYAPPGYQDMPVPGASPPYGAADAKATPGSYNSGPAAQPSTAAAPAAGSRGDGSGPLYAIALYDYAAQAEGDLSFNADDKIEITGKTNSTDDWWQGKCGGKTGMFPANYVREI
ncbi:BAR adaptor protein Hob1 [Dimargaris cristalligena]|nr:BAR adaptor protein Hob1 [Dimargaris cristalligena]